MFYRLKRILNNKHKRFFVLENYTVQLVCQQRFVPGFREYLAFFRRVVPRHDVGGKLENNAKKTVQFLDMFQELLYNYAHECFAGICRATTLGCKAFLIFRPSPFWGA
jgi:hypothetical protein